MIKKRKSHAFGKDIYLLGRTADGTNYWLEEAKWDCDWYWGGGYVETYTNNTNPARARDIESHQHFDSLFFKKANMHGHKAFTEFFEETPFTDKEIWQICDLMKSFYIASEFAAMVHTGGANYTENPVREILKSDIMYKTINELQIPAIMESLYEILSGEEKADV